MSRQMTCLCFGPPVDDCPIHGKKTVEPEGEKTRGGMAINVRDLFDELGLDTTIFERGIEKVGNASEGLAESIDRLTEKWRDAGSD